MTNRFKCTSHKITIRGTWKKFYTGEYYLQNVYNSLKFISAATVREHLDPQCSCSVGYEILKQEFPKIKIWPLSISTLKVQCRTPAIVRIQIFGFKHRLLISNKWKWNRLYLNWMCLIIYPIVLPKINNLVY